MMFPLIIAASMVAPKVQLTHTGDRWHLLRDGKPYFIRGGGGTDRMESVARYGGNSVRSWGAEKAGAELDRAQKLGLTMTVGIWLGHKSYFDYGDATKVKKQFEDARSVIRQHRNHPAVLMWGIGNEMELEDNDNPRLWQAIDDLHRMAKQEDPNHPAMTVVAEVNADKIARIKRYAPNLQVLGINSYGGAKDLAQRLKKFGWTKPFVLTEFGPIGPWETRKAPWGAAFEGTSTEKAAHYDLTYRNVVKALPNQSLGSYAFLWGNKQEETPTWFGMFLPSGEKTEAVDVIVRSWTGRFPPNQSPRVSRWNAAFGGQTVNPASELTAEVVAIDPERDRVTFQWEIRREVRERKFAGTGEETPGIITSGVDKLKSPKITFKAPDKKGTYRLYVTIRDGKGNAATANAPFAVDADR